MNEFKGTIGRWEINHRASRNVRCDNVSVANCSAGQSGELEVEERYNALLISKAPEMLKMLKKVLAENHCTPDTDKEIEQLIKEATEL